MEMVFSKVKNLVEGILTSRIVNNGSDAIFETGHAVIITDKAIVTNKNDHFYKIETRYEPLCTSSSL